MTDRRRKHMIDVIPLLLIFIAIATYLLSSAFGYRDLEGRTTVLREGWTEVDLEQHPTDLELHDAGVPTVMNIALGGEFNSPRSICFYSAFQSVEVLLDGEAIYHFDKPAGERHIQAPPSYWNVVAVPARSAGKQLEIRLITPYEQYANVLPEVRSGSEKDIDRYVLLKTLPRFVAGLAILFFGLIFALIAVAMRYYLLGSTGLYALSLLIVVLSIFLTFQQTTILLQINSDIPYILIQNIAFMLCPIFYTRYLMRVQSGIHHRISTGLHYLSILNAVVIIAMQALDIREMPQLMGLTGSLVAIIIVYAFALERARLLSERQQKRIRFRTFGHFDMFVDGNLVRFKSAKAKELLALCVSRLGGEVTIYEMVNVLWAGTGDQGLGYRTTIKALSDALKEHGAEKILKRRRSILALDTNEFDCDLADFKAGKGDAINAYHGEFLQQYAWAQPMAEELSAEKARR